MNLATNFSVERMAADDAALKSREPLAATIAHLAVGRRHQPHEKDHAVV